MESKEQWLWDTYELARGCAEEELVSDWSGAEQKRFRDFVEDFSKRHGLSALTLEVRVRAVLSAYGVLYGFHMK